MFSKLNAFIKEKLGKNQNSTAPSDVSGNIAREHILETHYDSLYVTIDAPPKVIRMAYIALQRKYHPDKNIGNEAASDMAQLINAAYQILSNPQERAAHDHWIRQMCPDYFSDDEKPPEKSSEKSDDVPAPIKKDPVAEKLKSDMAAWENLRQKAFQETEKAKQRAELAATKAETAQGTDKAKMNAWANQAAEEVKEAEQKVAKLDAQINSIRAKLNLGTLEAISTPALNGATHYNTLKVKPNAPIEVIDGAYRAMINLYGDGGTELSSSSLSGLMEKVEAAFKVLSDPIQKLAYDQQIRSYPFKKFIISKKQSSSSNGKESAQERAQKATNLATALAAHAEKTAAEVKELQAKVQEAEKKAEEKAGTPEAEKWIAWSRKLGDDVIAAKKRAQSAAIEANEAEKNARVATAAAASASDRSDRLGSEEIAASIRRREIRERAEKLEEQQQSSAGKNPS